MNAVQPTFPEEETESGEEWVLEFVPPPLPVSESPKAVFEAPLPPPPQWNDTVTTAALVEQATDAMLEKRYADAYDAFERALAADPQAENAATIRGNMNRLQQLLNR